MSRFPGLAALFVAVVAALPAPAQAVLRRRLDPRKPFYLQWKARKELWQTRMGTETHSTHDVGTVFYVRPLELKPDGGLVFELRVEEVTHQIVGGGPDYSLRGLEGEPVRMTLDRNRKVTGVAGIDRIANRFLGSNGTPATHAALEKQLANAFTNWAQGLIFPFPRGPVHPGDRWHKTMEEDIDSVGRLVSTVTYTDWGPDVLDGRPVRKLGLATVVTLSGTPPAPPDSPYQDRKAELKEHHGKGIAWFDPIVGRPVKIESTNGKRVAYTMTVQGQRYDSEDREEETQTLTYLDHNPLIGKGPPLPPQPPPAAALAREDKALPRTVTNSLGMKLVLIPRGKFLMGSPPSETGRTSDEKQHVVEITHPFYLDTHEVTVGQFKQFVKETGFLTGGERGLPGGTGFDSATRCFKRDRRFSWKDSGFAQTDEHPVCNVCWADAKAFCDWLSKKEGKLYRLPTEAEWEYACRAGTTTARFCGDAVESLVTVANVRDATASAKCAGGQGVPGDDGFAFTAPVGKFKPNAWGLYDMHGNVCEWCEDFCAEYSAEAARDPQGPAFGPQRVARGGSFADGSRDVRSARRGAFPPTDCYAQIGLRVVLCVPAKGP